MAQPPYQDPVYQHTSRDSYGQQPGAQQYPQQNTPYASQPGYPESTPPPAGQPTGGVHGGSKKRQYAAQAFDFGSGANAALTPAMSGGAYSAGVGSPGYPAEAFTPAPAGYIPPQPSYETSGVAGMTNQFGQMGFGGQPQTTSPQLQVQLLFLLTQQTIVGARVRLTW